MHRLSMQSALTLSLAGILCAVALGAAPRVQAQAEQVKPYFMVIVDNSGSMTAATTGAGTNSCGQARTRMSDAKCVLQRVLAGSGDAVFGLERFRVGTAGTASSPCVSTCGCTSGLVNTCTGDASAPNSVAAHGQVLVPIQESNTASLLEWVNFTAGSCGATAGTNPELTAVSNTPLAGALRGARQYYSGGDLTFPTSPIIGDTFRGCRPYYVILLTDGDETCSTQATSNLAATELRTTVVPGVGTIDIKTFVIGFGYTAADPGIEGLASAGGTDAPGANLGFYATDEATLSAAFSDIIASSIRTESCNNLDDNCNVIRDDGLPKFCNTASGVAPPDCSNTSVDRPLCTECAPPAETFCDGVDNNCNGVIDEGLRNTCGICGATPLEVCDGVDNNCNGISDEGGICGTCVPSAEICDGLDNDCDGLTDESLSRGCGTDLGECVAGTQTCAAGAWSTCTGVSAVAETCDGLDNDCDGVVDGMSRSCGSSVGTCLPGAQVCTAAVWGTCTGATVATTEVCDGRDNNCNGTTDEGNPGGGGTCGSSTGVCLPGTLTCLGGALTCAGGTSPGVETCNNRDDDCDGATDESLPTTGACGSSVGACLPGLLTCTAGTYVCVGARGATTEICNGIDDNCSGVIDEGNPGAGGSCGNNTGRCTYGAFQCTAGALVCTGGIGPIAETCNGIDDNCNGLTDEGNPGGGATCGTNTGECVTGTMTCAAGVLACSGGVTAVAETCNGLDDNCNGTVDESNPGGGASCGTDTGACVAGAMTCTGGTLVCTGSTGAATEVCNGIDDDCDGLTDEGNPGGGASCGSAVGSCRRGVQTCTAGALVCTGGVTAIAETCNNLDDNCNGLIDDGNPGGGASCGSSVGACRAGAQTCTAGVLACVGDIGPRAEICDGVDNNCNGTVDEGNPGGGATCGSAIGACRTGTLTCSAGGLVCTGSLAPAVETCNGIDDDCDGTVDDGIASPGSCGVSTGECDLGVQRCVGGAFVCTGNVGPVTELCDGRDNDCDGSTDEGNPGGGVTCGTSTGECAPGISECLAGVLVCTGGTPAAVEVCNGLDDNCDGLVDEGNPGGGGSCGTTDVGECEFGALACSGGALVCVGSTGPVAERCNGLDDDCDGVVDDGDPEGGAACGDDTGECTYGTTACVAGALICNRGTGPVPEVCNGLDDDCDGVADEGLAVGAPCGSSVGECLPGVFLCRDGGLVCEGEVGPTPEVCDALDNDCNGAVDDGIALGATCGSDVGVCAAGTQQCIAGRNVCVGEVLPTLETCNCNDDNCDGTVDEPRPDGTLCPGTSSCVDCACVVACVPSEFGPQCPGGAVPVMHGDACWCESAACDATVCATETHDSPATSAAACAPDATGLPVCVCKNNVCTFPCEGVVCAEGTVCDPRDPMGLCVPDDCRGLGCPAGEVCDRATGACTTDPCVAAACDEAQACRDGTCEPSCATTVCATGETCVAGVCVADLCNGVTCSAVQYCNPADGTCTGDLCVTGGVTCPAGTFCDPLTGSCDEDPCARLRCPSGQTCADGECVADGPVDPDGGVPDLGPPAVDLGRVDAGHGFTRVLASGGGGCVCDVPGAVHTGPMSNSAAWLAALGLAGLVFARRRRTALRAANERSLATRLVGGAVVVTGALALALVASGCDVNPYCIDCVTAADSGIDLGPVDLGTRDLGPDAGPPDLGPPDLGHPDGCAPGAPELCNLYDDNCDGVIDEGFDTTHDPLNCGGCGVVCTPPHAFATCEASVCGLSTCDVGWHDLNANPADGCEYRCTETATDDTLCDLRDNDCDGLTDEDVQFDTDPLNCGTCGHVCRFSRSTATCAAGTCAIDACLPGFYDADGVSTNGCEYACTPAVPAVEVCNGRDDNCDHVIDEGDPGGGGTCGSTIGACAVGLEACIAGAVTCTGGVSPSTETCNGVDDDCDGEVDQGNPQGGRLCGPGTGACTQGREVCTAGALACTGAVGPVAEVCNGLDDDCDGTIDDGNPDGGGSCGTDVGACVAGTFACRGGVVVCEGSAGALTEVCNGADDDCDGLTDEGNPGGGTLCGTDVGECTPGTTICTGGALVCTGAISATAETCNGLDDDCNGSVDEGDPGSGAACGTTTGACAAGTLHCRAGSLLCEGAIGPVLEVCNGVDDNCDGTIDEGNPGGGGSCGSDIGACVAGTRMCTGGALVCTGGTSAGVEICNGLDDNCDGTTDEGNPGGGATCGTATGECSTGLQTCVSGAVQCVGNVGTAPEICDGLDNDCDGVVDNGNPGGGAACGSGTGVCRTGVLTCAAGTFACVGGVSPGVEACNGLDDDCDGSVDESIASPGACGSAVGECRQGSQLCVGGVFTCVGGRGAATEVCDLTDNDCDGVVDDGNPGGGAACGSTTGTCRAGAVTCSAGALACVGAVVATAEVCNGLDDDCNGVVDNGNPGGGTSCGTDTGECVAGVNVCTGGAVVCTGAVGAGTETCNGRDDDCDGLVDDGNPGGGAACGSTVGTCRAGTMTCTSGVVVCTGNVAPTFESCNELDDDCDGVIDNGFNKTTSITNCGTCGHACTYPNGVASCAAGTCGLAGCLPGFVNLDGNAANGCEYACTFAGAEACNGRDDNCNGVVDDGLTVPSNFCNANGVCAGTPATCGGATGWRCTYPVATYQAVETRCDSLDNDCDGAVDEPYPLRNTACSNGVGTCRRTGFNICNAAQTGLVCSAAAAGTPAASELCNNLDDDCDGLIDEGIPLANIDTVLVNKATGGTMRIMQYEASRPDATAAAAGTSSTAACSRANVQPWTNVTWTEANNACCALNATGACAGTTGWRLCEALDWQEACEGPTAPPAQCLYSYAGASAVCRASATLTCNGEEYDSNAVLAGDQDALFSTGSATFPNCGTTWAGGVVRDLTGNAKEWTNTGSPAGSTTVHAIRGGSYNNVELGRMCAFDFTVGSTTFRFPNTGFRCCNY